MHIGIDASIANQDNKTGVDWYCYYLIEAIKKLEIGKDEHQYYLYTDQPLKGELAKLPENFHEIMLSWKIKYGWGQVRLAKELKDNPVDTFFVPGRMLPFYNPENTITTVHDVCFLEHPEYYSLGQKLRQKLALKRALKYSSKIITISDYTKLKLQELCNVSEDKIKVTPLAYDAKTYFVDKDKKSIDQTLEKYKIANPYVIFVGRLESKKNILRIVQAFAEAKKEMPDLELVLVGSPSFGWDEALHWLHGNEGLWNKSEFQHHALIKITEDTYFNNGVKFLGWLPQQEIRHLLSKAQVLVFPSLYEGFGIPVLEAQACGCPVITSNTTSLPEVAGESAILVDPLKTEEISSAIKQIISDKKLRQLKVKQGLENVKRYSWEETAKKTIEVLIK